MRKITLFLMTLMMVGSLFAYEPKKECARVKINGDVEYYENTEPHKPFPWGKYYSRNKDYEDHVEWVIGEGHAVEQFVDYKYRLLVHSRENCYFGIKKAWSPQPSDSEIASTELLNKMNGTNISPEEHVRSSWLDYAKSQMTWAVTCLAFVTEENYLTLTKEELYEKMNAFIEEVKSRK